MHSRKRHYQCKLCNEDYVPNGTAQKYCVTCIPNRAAYNRFLGWKISHPQWLELLASQGNACAICKTPFDMSVSAKTGGGVFIDHDHVTGRMRGVLCNGCNHGLGWVEKPGWLDAANQYLRKYSPQ